MPERVPNGWRVEPLCSLARVVSGGTPSRHVPEFWQGGAILWVTPTDLTSTPSRFLSDTRERITERGLNSCSAALLPPGTLLMSSRATLGELRIAAREVCTNQGFKSLVPLDGVDGRFLYYQMLRSRERYKAFGVGSTFLEVNKKDTERFEVLVAPGPDQPRIAEVLTAIDEAIEQTEALIAKTQQIKAGLMRDLFTRGVTPDGQLRPRREEAPKLYKESPLGWIPKEWAHGTLADIVSPNRPIMYGILMPGQGFPGGVPVVKVKDIVDGEIRTDDLLLTSPAIDAQYQRSKLRPGDILLSIRGTVGRVATVPTSLDRANITQDTARIGVICGEPVFYRYYLETAIPRRHFAVNTLGVAVQGVNLRDVRTTPAPIPKDDEQALIARAVEGCVGCLRAEKDGLAKLTSLRAGLMEDLLSGRVRIPPLEASKVAASV
jgi:type I restriction enzyme, S subunit